MFLVLTAFLLYPFLVFFGLQYVSPRFLYLGVGSLLLLRFFSLIPSLRTRNRVRAFLPFAIVGGVVVWGLISNSELLFLLLPGLVTLGLGGVFLYSLLKPPSMVETFARMTVPDLDEDDVTYCRRVTAVWVGFFLVNSLTVFLLTEAVRRDFWIMGYGPRVVWTGYTGVVSYALIGMLFAGEYLYRKWKFRRYGDSWPERFLRSVLPPRGNVKKTYIGLDELPVLGRGDHYPVTRTPEAKQSWSDFRQHTRRLTTRLRDLEPNSWTLTCEDGYAFAVGLMAIWESGLKAVLPPNRQPETLRTLAGDTGGIITDTALPFEAEHSLHPLEVVEEPAPVRLLNRETRVAELFTSGSTGQHQSVPKTLAQLQDEVFQLEEQWSHRVKDSTVLSTVSHQHIYGLLFKVLWPLSAGRAFDPRTGLYPGEIVESIIRHERDVTLVTSPTHLDKLVEVEDAESLAGSVNVIFSSGGPLSARTAHAAGDVLGTYPVEVLGSTETGGVAWRTQNPDTHAGDWRPFGNVRVRTSKRDTLLVNSPLLAPSDDPWHDMGDRAVVHDDGTFELKGRADRQINLAGKRVALPDVEQYLSREHCVEECAVFVKDNSDNGQQDDRAVLGGVVVLSQSGRSWLEKHSRQELIQRLRGHLHRSFDPVAIPRFWTFVDQLPRNEQGKVPVPRLRRLIRRDTVGG